MAYIGREPQIGNFQVCDAISVVNNQAAYTMQVGSVNVSPESANHMIVSLNGVIQKPTDAFTVSGSTITFAANLVTNDVINFIQILGNVLDLGVPSDNTVTLAKLASGTDGNLISYDASGNPVAVATGNDGQVLTSAGAGAVPAFETPASATNTPAFEATLGGSQAVSDATITKLTFTSETFDSDGTFASSRFTPAVAGTYFVYFKGLTDPAAYANERDSSSYFYKNGSNSGGFQTNFMTGGNASADGATAVCHTNHGIFVLDDNDYIEVYGAVNTWNGNNGNFKQKVFGGYRIII